MADQDFANVSWRDFYDVRRNRQNFQDLAIRRGSDGSLDLVGEQDGVDQWRFGDDEFGLDGMRGAREIVAAYAIYRRRVLEDGGEPDAFERPTGEGWE